MTAAAADWIVPELADLDLDDVDAFVESLNAEERRQFLAPLFDWEGNLAREAQKEPLGPWRVWLALAGRGWGKTRTGAEWIRKQVEQGLAQRIALVARTSSDGRDVLVEGRGGILAVSPPWMRPKYEPSKRRLTWFNSDGSVRAIATVYSADEPDLLRGPEHDCAWADELAAWKSKEAWDNLLLGLRVGVNPRVIATTTPKPTALIKELVARSSTTVTGGSTYENLNNLADGFIEDVLDRYEGTSLGEQELHARLLDEAEGALWRREWIEKQRWNESGALETDVANRLGPHPDLDSLVVAIDPAVSKTATGSESGIVAAGRAQVVEADGQERTHYFVIEDKSGRYTALGWAQIAANVYHDFDADLVIGERNNGGDLVESNLLTADDSIPVKTVWASRGKAPRAGPVAALYEQGRVHHVGGFRELEDQLCQWEPGEGTKSPDRLDALVWAISWLMPKGREKPLTTNLDLGGGSLDRESYWLPEEDSSDATRALRRLAAHRLTRRAPRWPHETPRRRTARPGRGNAAPMVAFARRRAA